MNQIREPKKEIDMWNSPFKYVTNFLTDEDIKTIEDVVTRESTFSKNGKSINLFSKGEYSNQTGIDQYSHINPKWANKIKNWRDSFIFWLAICNSPPSYSLGSDILIVILIFLFVKYTPVSLCQL